MTGMTGMPTPTANQVGRCRSDGRRVARVFEHVVTVVPVNVCVMSQRWRLAVAQRPLKWRTASGSCSWLRAKAPETSLSPQAASCRATSWMSFVGC